MIGKKKGINLAATLRSEEAAHEAMGSYDVAFLGNLADGAERGQLDVEGVLLALLIRVDQHKAAIARLAGMCAALNSRMNGGDGKVSVIGLFGEKGEADS